MKFIEGIEKQRLLADFSAWKTGGLAEYFVMPTTIDELERFVLWAASNDQAVNIISGGTNMLIADAGVQGLTISLKNFKSVEKIEKTKSHLKIQALAGTSKLEALKLFLREQLAPALFLAGLPGDLGGGVVMNAGVGEVIEPREFCELVDWIEVLHWTKTESKLKRILGKNLQWEYRSCKGWQPGIITRVALSWPLIIQSDIKKRVKEANKNRLNKQPLEDLNCGSVFRNPVGDKAGRLIESLGLKGHTIGGAQVSVKHANFIINTGTAKSSDILTMIKHIQQVVYSKCQIKLHPEVVLLGFPS